MPLSVEGSGDRWFSEMPRVGRIYQLIDDTGSGVKVEDRLFAISSLGESGDPRAVDALIGCCSDADPRVRHCAVDALGKIRSGRAVPALLKCLSAKNELYEIRTGAAMALAATRSDISLAGLKMTLSDPEEDPALCSIITQMLMEKDRGREQG